ncbi:MAG: hypothetical protein Q4P15_06280 [Propionibacteriaceae bacterium]|nr:hypothetical protein [Propionibacteriaceae bacterium]
MSEKSLASVPVGQRVTVRRRADDGRPTDTVGVVTGHDDESVTLETRQGPVRVLLSTVQVFRLVVPAPWRIANFLRRGDIAVLGLDAVLGEDAPTRETVELIEQLLTAETPVFILAEDAAGAVVALEDAELGHLAGLLLSPGVDQPGTDVLALAHARLQDQLGEVVAAGAVHYSAADPHAVEAARQLGWQARIFTAPDAYGPRS